VLDSTGEAKEKIEATVEFVRDTATITFMDRLPKGMVQLDGWFEEYKILRTDGHGFFGTWLTEIGPTVPRTGYFCARPK